MICRIDKNIKKGCSPYVLPDVREIYLLNYSDFEGYDIDDCEYCLDWDESSKWYRIDVQNASFSDSLAIGNNQNKYRNVSLTFSLYNSKDACVEEAYNAIVLGKYVAVFFANGVWYVSGLLNGMTVNESASDSESHTITLQENTTLTSQILNAECAQDVVDSANGEEPEPPTPPTPPSPYDDIVASFEITSTENVTRILSNWMMSQVERYIDNQYIDGVEQPTIFETYLFGTTGTHEVRYKALTNYMPYIFQNCTDLQLVSFPEIITIIDNDMFDGCTNLYAVSIPSSVNDIRLGYGNVGLFKNSGDISFIVVDEDNQTYDSRNFCNAIIETSSNILIVGGKDTIIPNTVVSIGNGAFYGRTGLTNIEIPDSVTSIGEKAFVSCRGLTNLTIPNTVVSIGNGAFSGCSGLTEITIGSGVTSIGSNAFNSCTSLTSITIEATTPPTLGGASAFNNTNDCPIYVPCQSVEAYKTATNWSRLASRITCVQPPLVYDLVGTFNVTSTSQPTSILGYYATSQFTDIEIDGVAQPSVVSSYTFSTTGNHTVKYKLPDNTSIGNNAFSQCTNLTNITIPNAITNIGNNALFGCTSLANVVIPSGVTILNNGVFNGCESLTSITIPSGVTSIGTNAFSSSGLTTVTIPNSVTSIGNNAFIYCSNLMSITVEATTPPTLGSGSGAFDGTNDCPIYVPCASVSAYQTNWSNYASRITCVQPVSGDLIGTFNVTDTTQPTQILYNTSARYYDSIEIDGVVQPSVVTSYTFSTTGEHTVKYTPASEGIIGTNSFSQCTDLVAINIPNTVISIGDYAFSGCSSLISVAIPSGVTTIGIDTFKNCTGLTSVTIPSGVTTIDMGAFSNCYSLTSITIPNSVTTINNSAFLACDSLTSITIPNSVTSIGQQVFKYCTGLTSITIEATTPPTLGVNAFDNTNNCPIYVPASSVNAYKTATNWSSYASRIQAIPNP